MRLANKRWAAAQATPNRNKRKKSDTQKTRNEIRWIVVSVSNQCSRSICCFFGTHNHFVYACVFVVGNVSAHIPQYFSAATNTKLQLIKSINEYRLFGRILFRLRSIWSHLNGLCWWQYKKASDAVESHDYYELFALRTKPRTNIFIISTCKSFILLLP